MAFDEAKVFGDTPGKGDAIHLNSAGSSLMPTPVLAAQVSHLKLEAAIGGYAAADKVAGDIARVYDSVAHLINCHRNEIALVESATVGWAMAFYTIPFEKGDRILTVEAEYASNYLAFLQMVEQKGVVIDIIPSDDNGVVCLTSLEEMIDDRVKLISVTHVPTNSGLVNPVSAIGEIASRHNILYLVDACQSAGQIPLDVQAIKCDMLSATGRKYLRGPRGVGFLYVRSSVIERLHPPIIDLLSAEWQSLTEYTLRPDARRFETWESNYAAQLGLGMAVDYTLEIGLDIIQARIGALADYLREQLSGLSRVTLHRIGQEQCGIVSCHTEGLDAIEVVGQLREKGIEVSVSHPSSTLIDATKHQLPRLLRASVHYFNDTEELDQFLEALRDITHS